MSPVKQICGLKPCGLFGAVRKNDIHTGVDFYCSEGEYVACLNDGIVVDVFQFTGADAGSPWWNDTQAIVVECEGLTFVYGEVVGLVSIGDHVKFGQIVGRVVPVLKQDKGVTPTSMLHLEVWRSEGYQKNYTWKLDTPKPDGLLNPLNVLSGWLIKTEMGYILENYRGLMLEWFDMAANSKAYCMEKGIDPVYITTKSALSVKEAYEKSTGKPLWFNRSWK